jgi:hypothetical protein
MHFKIAHYIEEMLHLIVDEDRYVLYKSVLLFRVPSKAKRKANGVGMLSNMERHIVCLGSLLFYRVRLCILYLGSRGEEESQESKVNCGQSNRPMCNQ